VIDECATAPAIPGQSRPLSPRSAPSFSAIVSRPADPAQSMAKNLSAARQGIAVQPGGIEGPFFFAYETTHITCL